MNLENHASKDVNVQKHEQTREIFCNWCTKLAEKFNCFEFGERKFCGEVCFSMWRRYLFKNKEYCERIQTKLIRRSPIRQILAGTNLKTSGYNLGIDSILSKSRDHTLGEKLKTKGKNVSPNEKLKDAKSKFSIDFDDKHAEYEKLYSTDFVKEYYKKYGKNINLNYDN